MFSGWSFFWESHDLWITGSSVAGEFLLTLQVSTSSWQDVKETENTSVFTKEYWNILLQIKLFTFMCKQLLLKETYC